jgi:hypothetical protein
MTLGATSRIIGISLPLDHHGRPETFRPGIVRVNSILPVRTLGRAEAPLFLLTNCRRARPDSTPKIAYTYLP